MNGGLKAQLILDTGASHTVLSWGLANRASVPSSASNGSAMNTVAEPVRAEVVRVNAIQGAEMNVTDTIATIFDLPDAPPDIDGLLGLSFLGRFKVTLDTENPKLPLSPSQK